MSKRKSSTRKTGGPLAGTPVGDIAAAGQAMISEAQDRASDAVHQVTKLASEAANTLEKRRDSELKNLRDLVKDVNKSLGGLEKRYRTMESRLTKQIETLSGRAVKASDLDKRIRALENEIRKATGFGAAAAGSARRTATATTRGATRTASKAASTAKRSAAQRTSSKSTAAKVTAAAKKDVRATTKKATGTAKKAAKTTTRKVAGAARTASTAVSTAAKAASTGAAAGATSARRSAAGSAGGRKTAAKRPAAKRSSAAKPASNGTGGSSS